MASKIAPNNKLLAGAMFALSSLEENALELEGKEWMSTQLSLDREMARSLVYLTN